MDNSFLQAQFDIRLKSFHLQFEAVINHGFTALFGPSGCGKTTTLKCLSGLLQPDSGFIQFNSTPFFSHENKIFVQPEKRGIGHVFQDSRLFPHMSVKQNLLFGYGLTQPHERHFFFDDVIALLKLSPLLDRSPHSLSGGEAQRVAIGRALLASPQLLLLDEPLAAIDQPNRINLLTSLKQIHQEFTLPIVYVSHDLSTVLNIADSALLMRSGKVEASGDPFIVLKDFVSSDFYSQNTLQNIFKVKLTRTDEKAGTCTVAKGNVEFTLPRINANYGDEFFLDIPGSEIIIATERPYGLSARNILPGLVTNIQSVGGKIFIGVDAGIQVKVEVVEKTVEALKLANGKQVFLIIKATAFRRIN